MNTSTTARTNIFRKAILAVTVVLLAGLLHACKKAPEGVEPVDGFELPRYLGTWHEIARLDHSFQRGLSRVTATYSLRDDGGVHVVNRGFSEETGEWEEAIGKAYFTGESDVGQLKVSFFGPFYGGYNVIQLDKANYQYSLVAGPKLDYLWILSRTPELDPAILDRLVEYAAELGFATDELIFSEQGPLGAAKAPSTADEASTNWAETFRDDLQAARRIILESHPGPVDALNPAFGDWLETGFEQQMKLAESVDTADAYVYAMQKFVGGFRDGHLNIRFGLERGPPRWPGFFTTWRNGTVVVHTVDPAIVSELAEGDRLQSCDGQTGEILLRQRVFDFQYDPALPAQWVPAAARAFLDLGNPFADVPRRCIFVRGDNEIAVDLEWREFSWDERRGDYSAARGRTRPEVGLYVPEPGVYWLQAPTFGPNESQVARYHDAFRQLREARTTAKLVVLDLRGNDGGSSMWADLFAEALWNKTPDDDSENDTEFVEWRVSEGNVAYWETVPSMIREQFGDSHSAYGWSNHVLRHLATSLRDGRDLWRETPVDGQQDSKAASTTEEPGAPIPRYGGTVVVLTDTACGSACLDAMSLLGKVPGVIHVGSVTAADTQYMESRPALLPSGLATLVIPIKVYRDRVRPDGGYFTPEIRYEGLHWTDERLRTWVLSLWREGALQASEHPR